MNDGERLKRIAQIIEHVDNRCMAVDGSVPSTLEEMTQKEISEIYKLASQPKDSVDVYLAACPKCGYNLICNAPGDCDFKTNPHG